MFLEQNPVDMKGVFTQSINKEKIGYNNGASELEGLG
jgi:hypothetical protein